MTENEKLLKKLRDLGWENERLCKITFDQTITAREEDYNGYHILTIERPFRAFSSGPKKLRVVIACQDEVKSFLSKHDDIKGVESEEIFGPGDLQI